MEKERHVGLHRTSFSAFLKPSLLVLALVCFALFISSPVFLAIVIILAFNTLIETNKRFLGHIPLDIEILYAGTALLAATSGFIAGLSIALLGPALAEFAHLKSSREIVSRTIGLVVVACAALALPATLVSMLLAIMLGLLTHFLAAGILYGTFGYQNYLRRLSTFALALYLLSIASPLASVLAS